MVVVSGQSNTLSPSFSADEISAVLEAADFLEGRGHSRSDDLRKLAAKIQERAILTQDIFQPGMSLPSGKGSWLVTAVKMTPNHLFDDVFYNYQDGARRSRLLQKAWDAEIELKSNGEIEFAF